MSPARTARRRCGAALTLKMITLPTSSSSTAPPGPARPRRARRGAQRANAFGDPPRRSRGDRCPSVCPAAVPIISSNLHWFSLRLCPWTRNGCQACRTSSLSKPLTFLRCPRRKNVSNPAGRDDRFWRHAQRAWFLRLGSQWKRCDKPPCTDTFLGTATRGINSKSFSHYPSILLPLIFLKRREK